LSIRQAAVAGTFYPADKEELTAMIDSFYANASDQPAVGKALIAPHAGYIYSGEIAASCYAPLRKRKNTISKVVLLGPSHYVGFMGMALPTVDFFTTPLGDIPIDKELHKKAIECEDTFTLDNAHLQEHSLEVHLPFLQKSLESFTLLPVVVGQCDPKLIAKMLHEVWGGPETLIVISTDMSHFKNYQDAQKCDQKTADNIVNFNIESIDHYDACGSAPVLGLLQAIKNKFKIKLIDIRNSGDTAGDKDRVVGYASFICDEQQNLKHIFSKKEKQKLLSLARATIAKPLSIEESLPDCSEITNSKTATFVTLKIDGQLRGCIGTLSAHRKLLDDIKHNARAAAFEDPRFPPLSAAEFSKLEVNISILTSPEDFPVESEQDLLNKLTPGEDGLILTDGAHRSTFLPSVWEELTDPLEFLQRLKRKAGLPVDYWSSTIQFKKYHTICVS
jgi:AmmeMemoRadiSam system protein B/AmmeMemoRadiSam system protein A